MSAYIDKRPSGDQREAAIDARRKTFEPPCEIVGDQNRVRRFRDVDERAVEIQEERHRLPHCPVRKRGRKREAIPFVHRSKVRDPECEGQPSTGRPNLLRRVSEVRCALRALSRSARERMTTTFCVSRSTIGSRAAPANRTA